jgi:hypothetical protein
MDRERLFALVVAAALGYFGGSLATAGTVNINPSKDTILWMGIRVMRLAFISSPVRPG